VADFETKIKESHVLLLQNEVPEAVNIAAARLAKRHGVTVVLNPAPARPISEELAKLLNVVTPNEQEREALEGLHVPACITTLGGDGCDVDGIRLPAFPVEAVDTTGAGDTFNGALAVGLAEGKPLLEACRYASAAASLSVTKKGVLNAIPYKEEIERMIGV
jgi:ribokinase